MDFFTRNFDPNPLFIYDFRSKFYAKPAVRVVLCVVDVHTSCLDYTNWPHSGGGRPLLRLYIYLSIYPSIYLSIYICIHIYTYIYINIYMYIYICIYVYINMYRYMYLYIHTYTYVHVHIFYIYIYAYIGPGRPRGARGGGPAARPACMMLPGGAPLDLN